MQPDGDCAKDEQAGIDSRREPLRNLWDDLRPPRLTG